MALERDGVMRKEGLPAPESNRPCTFAARHCDPSKNRREESF